MTNPTVGRMVYYKARGSADGMYPKVDRASIVTDVREVAYKDSGEVQVLKEAQPDDIYIGRLGYQCRVAVINPEGLFFSDWLDQGQEGGQWDWMPFQKDQQARLAPGTADESHK